MGKMEGIASLAAVGIGAYALWYFFVGKNKEGTNSDAYNPLTNPGGSGGSILNQLSDATIGQIIGAPSRFGSTGTSGVIGNIEADILGWRNGLIGQQAATAADRAAAAGNTGSPLPPPSNNAPEYAAPAPAPNAIIAGVPFFTLGGGIANPLPTTLLNTGVSNPFVSSGVSSGAIYSGPNQNSSKAPTKDVPSPSPSLVPKTVFGVANPFAVTRF